jgi:hypothetical protein
MHTIQHIQNFLISLALAVLLLFYISYVQAVFTAPTAQPSNANRATPITLGSVTQEKLGTIEAENFSVTNGIILGGVGRTVGDGWPTGTNTTGCYMNVVRVGQPKMNTFTSDSMYGVNDMASCEDYLTTQAKADGWFATGEDNCDAYDNDCDSTSPYLSFCQYARWECANANLQICPSVESRHTYTGGLFTIPNTATPLPSSC